MRPQIKGWCPGAWRPMLSGDGLVVRVRPRGGRLASTQTLAQAALRHGNGWIDLTSRANIQIRGVTENSHPALLEDLAAMGLLDDPVTEARRNITHSPFAETLALAEAITAQDLPVLPDKFGFLLDTGKARWLADTPGDIRIERGHNGLILRADGAATGMPVTEADAPQAAADLARWFLASGGAPHGRGRMAAHIARTPLPATLSGDAPPAPAMPRPAPGMRPEGALVALEFGQMRAETLAEITAPVRVTPWRMLLLETRTLPNHPDLITDPADPLLRVVACTGAPGCPQALAETRALARRLAPHVPPDALLHVSGCAKGCAHPMPAPLTLVATGTGFAMIRGGRASDPKTRIVTDPFDAL